MFIPTEDLIIGKGPRAGMFYRRAASTGTTVAQIAHVAAYHLRQEGYDVSTFQMVQLIANSTWNHAHIRYARTGYENYGFDGPQMQKRYAHDPISTYGSGSGWPTFWIPTADGKEPGQLYGPTAPPGSPSGLPLRSVGKRPIQAVLALPITVEVEAIECLRAPEGIPMGSVWSQQVSLPGCSCFSQPLEG
jgi:hypothetical protein